MQLPPAEHFPAPHQALHMGGMPTASTLAPRRTSVPRPPPWHACPYINHGDVTPGRASSADLTVLAHDPQVMPRIRTVTDVEDMVGEGEPAV